MKQFLALLGLIALCSGGRVLRAEPEVGDLDEFIANVKAVLVKLQEQSRVYVCSAKLVDLLELMGMPEEMAPAVKYGQAWYCSEDEEELPVVKREVELRLSAAEFYEMVESVKGQLAEYTYELVCSSKLPALLTILGLPSEMDGVVKMAQEWYCGEDLHARAEELQLRMTSEEFYDTVMIVKEQLAEFTYEIVCSAKLPQILTLLGLPADFDGTVKIAQEWYCGDDLHAVVKRDLVITEGMQLQMSDAFYETVAEIQKQLAGYTYEIVCSSKLPAILTILGLPVELNGAVALAQKYYCGEDLHERALSLDFDDFKDFVEEVKKIYGQLLQWKDNELCMITPEEALEWLNLPESMFPAVRMAYGWICDED